VERTLETEGYTIPRTQHLLLLIVVAAVVALAELWHQTFTPHLPVLEVLVF
jgi:hypothetical protein